MTDIINFVSAKRGVEILEATSHGYIYDVNLAGTDIASLEKAVREGKAQQLLFATLPRMFVLSEVYEVLFANEEAAAEPTQKYAGL